MADIAVPLLGAIILGHLKSLEESDEGPYEMGPRCLFSFRIGTSDRFAEDHWCRAAGRIREWEACA